MWMEEGRIRDCTEIRRQTDVVGARKKVGRWRERVKKGGGLEE